MPLIKEELMLLDVFRKNPLKSLTFNEIMDLAKKESKTWVFNKLKKFTELGFLEKIKVNNSYLYKANLKSFGLINFFHPLDFAEAHIKNAKWPKDVYNILNKIRINIFKVTPFFIMLVFGSYVEKKYSEKSDLDIAIIVDSKDIKIKPYIEKIIRKEIIQIDYHIITKQDFKEMLLREEENLGKEIYRKHITIWGGNSYYELIRQAGENGFKG